MKPTSKCLTEKLQLILGDFVFFKKFQPHYPKEFVPMWSAPHSLFFDPNKISNLYCFPHLEKEGYHNGDTWPHVNGPERSLLIFSHLMLLLQTPMHLSRKIPPEEQHLIYHYECDKKTNSAILTFIDFIDKTYIRYHISDVHYFINKSYVTTQQLTQSFRDKDTIPLFKGEDIYTRFIRQNYRLNQLITILTEEDLEENLLAVVKEFELTLKHSIAVDIRKVS